VGRSVEVRSRRRVKRVSKVKVEFEKGRVQSEVFVNLAGSELTKKLSRGLLEARTSRVKGKLVHGSHLVNVFLVVWGVLGSWNAVGEEDEKMLVSTTVTGSTRVLKTPSRGG
jgi:hypothetical protein